MALKRLIVLISQIVTIIVLVAGLFILTKKQVSPITVYQFTGDIKANTEVTAADFKAITIPKTAVTADFVLRASDLQDYMIDTETNQAGSYVVSTDVFEGQYVTKQLLVPSEKRDLLKELDLTNYRQMAIPVSLSTAVGGWINKGETVDLAYLSQGKGKNSENFTYSTLFMQDVLVNDILTGGGYQYVSVYSDLYEDMYSTWDGKVETQPTENTSDMAYLIVTVTTEQALELTTRMKTGQISVMRRFEQSKNQEINDYIIGDQGEISTGQGVVEVE